MSGVLPFRKIDLHIHTPWSDCYGDPSVTPRRIVEAALASGLDALAVTDHNTIDGVDAIRDAAGGNGLVVFPGVEVTTCGGHFLILFDPDAVVAEIGGFLNEIGLGRGNQGDGSAVAEGTVQQVLRGATERGGLAIAAHIERWPNGFLETNQPRKVKMAIHTSDDLAALEISVPDNKSRWNEGRVRGYPRERACTQGSDAHSPEEIGRRMVLVRMEAIDLESLRAALRNHASDVVFPEGTLLQQG